MRSGIGFSGKKGAGGCCRRYNACGSGSSSEEGRGRFVDIFGVF